MMDLDAIVARNKKAMRAAPAERKQREANQAEWQRRAAAKITAGTSGGIAPKAKHRKRKSGLCKICGHYGSDCTGTDYSWSSRQARAGLKPTD